MQLTFDEAVEPRFAIISVTDKDASSQTTGPVTRSPSNPDTLVVPLKPHLPEGWYLVYWRAISVDGHPVQGAFTFAVGPNPGPAPQFVIPHIGQSATTTPLVVARWLALLTVMVSIGLLALRLAIARRVIRKVPGSSLRDLTVAFGIASTLGLVAIVVYVEESTAVDSLRSFFDVARLVPLWRTTAFGRGYVDLLLCFALLRRRRLDRDLGRPARAGAAVGRRAAGRGRRRRRRGGRVPDPGRRGARRADRARAASPWRSTGSTSAPGRSGSAA